MRTDGEVTAAMEMAVHTRVGGPIRSRPLVGRYGEFRAAVPVMPLVVR